MPGHLGFAIGRPTPSRRRLVNEVLQKLQQLARGSQASTLSLFPYFLNEGETLPFPFTRGSPLLRITNPETTLLMNLPTTPIATEDVRTVHENCRFYRRLCLAAGGRDDGTFF